MAEHLVIGWRHSRQTQRDNDEQSVHEKQGWNEGQQYRILGQYDTIRYDTVD